jgi:monoterpene epsilon-lactone hydrolase
VSKQEVETIIQALVAGAGPSGAFSVEQARRTWYIYTEDFKLPASLEAVRETIGAVPAEWLRRPEASKNRAVLYLHGGGYVCGGIATHWPISSGIAERFDGAVCSIDYRLAPEHAFPAQIEDTIIAYRHMLDLGIPAEGIAFAGESAGGGLVVGAMLAAREAGLPLPGAGWAISPWSDLTLSGGSLESNAPTDVIVFRQSLELTRDLYLNGASYAEPQASPIFADLRGLPPLLIQVAAHEILLDDAINLARVAAHANVDVTLESWPGLLHAWHLFARDLEEGRRAIRQGADWLNARLA